VENEVEGNTQVTLLRALGVLRELSDDEKCPSCLRVMSHEATYVCSTCNRRRHVRCMGHYACELTERATKYSTECFLCRARVGHQEDGAQRGRITSAPLIIDVMGVCASNPP
jgi:hypothetical protein